MPHRIGDLLCSYIRKTHIIVQGTLAVHERTHYSRNQSTYERPRVHDDIIVMDDDVMMYSWKDPYSIGINLHKKDPQL